MRNQNSRFSTLCLIVSAMLWVGESQAAAPQALTDKVVPKSSPLKVEQETIRFRPGKGLSFSSKDRRFAINLRLRAQFRYGLTQPSANDEGAEHAFQIRRARVVFAGNAFGENNKFKLELAVSPRDLGIKNGVVTRSPLLDFYFQLGITRDLNVRVGQYKVPFSRQRLISSGNLQFVDRSSINKEFALDRDIGVDIRSNDFLGLGLLRYSAGVFIGEGHSSFEPGDLGLMYLVRLEVLPFGMFKDYREADLRRLHKPRLSLGLAYGYLDRAKKNKGITGKVPADGGTTNSHNVAADLVFKYAGFALQAEFAWRQGERQPGSKEDPQGSPIPVEEARNGLGFFVQSSYLVPKIPLEIAFRFEQIRPLSQKTSLPTTNAVGGAISYYFFGHPFKLQLDYFMLWKKGDLALNQHQLRLQLQAGL